MRIASLLAYAVASAAAIGAPAVSFFVDCESGSDGNAGSSPASPFASLMRARDAVRALPRPLAFGGVLVTVASGSCYPLNGNYSQAVLQLDDPVLDSGSSSAAPISWVGGGGSGGVTVLSAGVPVPASAWVSDGARPGCFAALLSAVPGYDAAVGLGSLSAGSLGQCASDKAMLAHSSALTTPARWPNIDATGEWQWLYATNTTSRSLTVNTTRPLDKAWPSGKAWLHGFWQFGEYT